MIDLTTDPIMGTIDPVMGSSATNNVSASLFGKVRSAILAVLFRHTDQAFHLRQVIRVAGVGYGAGQRELAALVKNGLAVRSRQGNLVLYQANLESPIFPEIRDLMVKTAGLADVLKAAFAPIADRITAAFIYGSFAKGSESSASDVDVMLIGDISMREVVSALRPAHDELHREINPSLYSTADFRNRVVHADHFITSLLREPKIMLIGDEHDLGQTD